MAVVKQPQSPDYGAEIDRGEKVSIPTNNARQGVSHQHVWRILVISTITLVLIFGIVYLLFFAV